MSDVPFPLISAPGRHAETAGGRLVNTYVEQLSETAGKKYAYWRSPGLRAFATLPAGVPRGSIVVGGTTYSLVGTKVYSVGSNGAVATLTGVVPGTVPVFFAANNAAVPDIVIVSPTDGAFIISGGGIASYPDIDVGQPNSVKYHKGYFVFTYGNGVTRTSGINTTAVNTNDYASAESKPDTLYCSIPLGNGQILLCGSATIEAWTGTNDTGYPFNYVATIPRGIVGPYAITGDIDGFGKGIFFVGDDFGVHTLSGYETIKISSSDVDLAIERTTDKTSIRASCFIAAGHSFVAIQSATWCWVYDVGVQTWHERESYLKTYWKGAFPLKAFNKWLCSDIDTGSLVEITSAAQDELGQPLRMRVQTGPLGAFPSQVRIDSIELYLTKGVGYAPGTDPTQTDPLIEVSMSPDGLTWRGQRDIKVGRQAVTSGRVRAFVWGRADVQGVRWRFDFSSNVSFGLLGADMKADQLR